MTKKFQLLTPAHKTQLTELVKKISKVVISEVIDELEKLIERIRDDIPEKKRISYGRYSIIKKMGLEMYPALETAGVDIYGFASAIFSDLNLDPFVRSLALQLISIYGLQTGDLKKVMPKFEVAAADASWEVRECASGFVGKLTNAFPEHMHRWYMKMAKSNDSMQRRFASESLRPVSDNRWLRNQPDFAFSIIVHLFNESESYPRTSVGNNLSDWMRIDEERACGIVKELAKNGDENSHWIAYRACRNLVKTKPLQVMTMLGVEKYKYKKRVYNRKDYEQHTTSKN